MCVVWCPALGGSNATKKDPGLRTFSVPRAGEAYGVTVSVRATEAFAAGSINVTISDAQGVLTAKTLYPKDLNFYASVKVRRAGELSVRLVASGASLEAARVKVEFSSLSLTNATTVATQPNREWRDAQPLELGHTVFGLNDEQPYVQWFQFTVHELKLVSFSLDTHNGEPPPDVDLFTTSDGKLVPVTGDAHMFLPSLTYYLRVAANHSAYRLHSYSPEAMQEQLPAAPVIRTEHLDQLLTDIETLGVKAPALPLRRILTESKWTLARAAAAEALGRIHDVDSMPLLSHALGDSSKLVQRASAEALRAFHQE